MKVFVAVAECGSFVQASHRLELSAPSVTRSVARLESFLGVKLFHRTTRAIRLTEAGELYFANVKRIFESIDEAESAIGSNQDEPQGRLVLTAPVLFGQIYIVPVVTEFLRTYPKVTVRTVFHDRVTNLLEENLDVAVRIGALADSSLFATEVGSVRKVVCASPEYLSERGMPKTPDDLAQHDIVHATNVESSTTWTFNDEKVKVNPRYQCNQNQAAVRAAELGIGLTRVMSYQAADAISAGLLLPVLEQFEPTSVPINIVYLEGRKAHAKVRAFVDFAAAELRENVFLNPHN